MREIKVFNDETNIKRFMKTIKKCKLSFTLIGEVNEKILDCARNYLVYEVDVPNADENDWVIVKRFDHLDKLSFTFEKSITIEESMMLNEKYIGNCTCEHCGKKIEKRRYSYLLKNKKTNEFKQVGTSCLCAYIPRGVYNVYDDLMDMDEVYDYDKDSSYYTESFSYDSKFIVMNALKELKSADYDYYKFKNETNVYDYIYNGNKFEEDIVEMYENLVKYVEEKAEYNDYIFNINALIKSGYVNKRNLRLLASCVSLYNRMLEDKKRKELKSDFENTCSNTPLAMGKNCVKIVKYVKTTTSHYDIGYYGVSSNKIHVLTDNNEYLIITANGSIYDKILDGIKNGGVNVKLTVTKNSVFNDITYNFANRAKIVE